MADVTVLMPVYNGERYLREAIDSILNQRFRDFEFLILDDGSTDNTASIIRSYSDDRIRFLTNPKRLRLSGALNRGMEEARGTFIARMDADDIARPDRLARQLAFLRENPETGICGAWVRRFGSVKTRIDRNPTGSEEIRAYALFECPFSHPTVMFRRDLLMRAGLRYNGEFYPTEDYELWARAVHLFPCANIPEVLLDYRVHSAGMTGAEWSDMDAKGARIGAANLVRLGFEPTEEEVWLHRNVGRAGGRRWRDIAELGRAENWLTTLWRANERFSLYEKPALQKVLNLVWFRVCFHASPLGLEVLSRFCRRAMGAGDRLSLQRSVLIFLAILKNRGGARAA